MLKKDHKHLDPKYINAEDWWSAPIKMNQSFSNEYEYLANFDWYFQVYSSINILVYSLSSTEFPNFEYFTLLLASQYKAIHTSYQFL